MAQEINNSNGHVGRGDEPRSEPEPRHLSGFPSTKAWALKWDGAALGGEQEPSDPSGEDSKQTPPK